MTDGGAHIVRSPEHGRALAYAAAGIPVFPCRPDDKKPACQHGVYEATCDAARIDAWWSHNPAYRVGLAIGMAGLCAVDLDVKRVDGRANWRALCDQNGHNPETWGQQSPSGGGHLLYRGTLRNTVGALAAGIDTRGSGGYIIAYSDVPPDLSWEIDQVPAFVVEQAGARQRDKKKAAPDVEFADRAVDIEEAKRRIAYWLQRHGEPIDGGGTGNGNSDHLTFHLAAWLLDLPLTETAIVDLLCEHYAPAFDREFFEDKMANAIAYRQNDRGCDPQRTGAETFKQFAFDWEKPAKADFKPFAEETIYRKLTDAANKDGAVAFIRQCRSKGYAPQQVIDLFKRFPHTAAAQHYKTHPDGSEAALRADIERAFTVAADPLPDRPAPDVFRVDDNDVKPARRSIPIAGDFLGYAVSAAETALIEQNAALFQRGDFIVRPGAARIETRGGVKVDGERLFEVRPAELREMMTTCAEFVRWDVRTGTWKHINCPEELSRAYAERRGRWKLRPLAGIVTAPTLREDGSILDQPGYDAASELLFAPGATFPAIFSEPTRADALAALATLKNLFATFPFETDADRAVALSGVLTAVVRRVLPTAPLHAFSAPRRGTGKGKLVDIAAVIATGRPAAAIVQGANEEETEKRLGALLLSGDPVVQIDNCTVPLGGQFICSLMTQEIVQVRILGQSKTARLPGTAMLFATGNNFMASGDMGRRLIVGTIDAALEFPETRVFDSDPVEQAKRDRPRYLTAALTVLRAYVVAGRPRQRRDPFGSFEQWSRLVRDALLWLGEADPCDTRANIEENDQEREKLATLLHWWAAVIGPAPVSTKTAIELATEFDADAKPVRPDGQRLIEAFRAVAADHRGEINMRALGRYLRSQNKTPAAGHRIVRVERPGKNDGAIWQVETLPTIGRARS